MAVSCGALPSLHSDLEYGNDRNDSTVSYIVARPLLVSSTVDNNPIVFWVLQIGNLKHGLASIVEPNRRMGYG